MEVVSGTRKPLNSSMWVVLKIMDPLWLLVILRHLLLRGTKMAC